MTQRIKSHSLRRGLPLLAAALCLAALPVFGATSEVSFADKTKPGRLKIYISKGDLRISPGDNLGLVSVVSLSDDSEATTKQPPREDGLRVLSDSSNTFSLNVQDNQAELNFGKESWPGAEEANLEVKVPKDTVLEIHNGWGGLVKVDNIDGDTSIKGLNCEVELNDVAGATSVETMNGEIKASFRSLSENKPVSISTMNGEVLVRVPEKAAAQVRFRSHNGSILTDFSEDRLKTKSENLGGTNWGAMAGKHIVIATEIAREVSEGIAQHAEEAAREMEQSMAEVEKHAAEAEKHAAEAEQHAAEVEREAPKAPKPPKTPKAAKAPRPPSPPNIPAISGGKVVSGTLNGGGTPIQITTMNGDITFRKR